VPTETPDDKGKLVIEFEQQRGFEQKIFKEDREKDRYLTMHHSLDCYEGHF
jgi:hypothetical protein